MKLKIRKTTVFFFVLIIIIEILLVCHYFGIGVDEGLLGFAVITLMGFVVLLFSFEKWHNLLNPLSLYFIFIFGFGFSLLNISKYVKPYDNLGFSIIFITIISFITGVLINYRFLSPFRLLKFNHRSNLIFYFILIFISFVSFIYELYNIGYIPVFRMFSFDVYNDANTRLVSFVHYFVMLFAIIPSWTFILYKKGSFPVIWVVFVLFISFFVIINYLSRQTILLLLISNLVTISFYYKIDFRKLLLTGFVIIFIFFVIGNLRMNQQESIKINKKYSPSEFLQNVAGMKYKSNLVESTYVIYSSIRYQTFSNFVKKSNDEDFFGFGKYTLRPLVTIFCLDKMQMVEYNSDFNVNIALPTYAIDSYLDFGFLGVIIVGFFYGIISVHFFINYLKKKEQYILPWTIIIFCIIMMPFMNYFGSFFIFLIWISNKLIIS